MPQQHPQRESVRSVAATVGWMMATLATLVAMIAVVGLQLWALSAARNQGILVVARLMLFIAAVSGVAALVMLGVTWRVREDRPPTPIVVASVVIAVTPLMSAAYVLIR